MDGDTPRRVVVDVAEEMDVVLRHEGVIVAVIEIGKVRELSPGRFALPVKGHPVLLREPARPGWRRLATFGTSIGVELEQGGDLDALDAARRP